MGRGRVRVPIESWGLGGPPPQEIIVVFIVLFVRMYRCSSVLSVLRAVVMAASSALLIVCLSFWDLISMCIMCSVFGLTTPAPSVLLPLTCEPSVYTKSIGFHFLVWGFVCRIVGVWGMCAGAGISLYAVMLSMVIASCVLISMNLVFIVWPYVCVSAIFIVCCVVLGSIRLRAFWLATKYMFRLYFLGWVPVVVCVCGSVTIFWM